MAWEPGSDSASIFSLDLRSEFCCAKPSFCLRIYVVHPLGQYGALHVFFSVCIVA